MPPNYLDHSNGHAVEEQEGVDEDVKGHSLRKKTLCSWLTLTWRVCQCYHHHIVQYINHQEEKEEES